jgi:hypothetical protein
MSVSYNPDFNPTGIEGGVDTHTLPWIPLPAAPGIAIKPLRASSESGAFSVILRIAAGAALEHAVLLGAMDMMLLSGSLRVPAGPLAGSIEPGCWGYVPANARIDSLAAESDSEFLANFQGPLCFLNGDGREVRSMLTALDVMNAARARGIALIPNTLAECMAPRLEAYAGPAEPLTIAGDSHRLRLTAAVRALATAASPLNPHFVDTRALAWIVNTAVPDMGLKILRVSEETGHTSLLVRHNGVAGPHYHLGAADFLILNGRIGYRAGPPQGYGQGVWFYEPAGARHEATQRIGSEDLIYTANVYGPLQFDSGPGTPILAVQSWMQYKMIADQAGVTLARNTFDHDESLLAWTPIGQDASPL